MNPRDREPDGSPGSDGASHEASSPDTGSPEAASPGAIPPEAVSPEAASDAIADYLGGTLQGREREHFEARVLAEPELAQALYRELNLDAGLDDLAEARRAAAAGQAHSPYERATSESASTDLRSPAPPIRPRRAVEDPRDPWWVRWKLQLLAPALAVAALAVILLIPQFRDGFDPQAPVLRSGAEAVRGLGPSGDLDSPPRQFHWTGTAEAYVYRLDVFDIDSRFLFGSTTRDTTATAPNAAVSWPREGYWQVTAMSQAGVELSVSEPVRFRISP